MPFQNDEGEPPLRLLQPRKAARLLPGRAGGPILRYLQEIIVPGETVRHVGKLHWMIYVRGFLVIAVFAVAWIAIKSSPDIDLPPSLPTPLLVGVGLGILLVLNGIVRQATTEIVITDRRAIVKTGFFARRTLEMNMDKIESVDVSQSALGRALGFGTVALHGTGTRSNTMHDVANPIELRRAVTAS
jgi:uncharacterized membrane protein YdbT with pleckstrin-like domain